MAVRRMEMLRGKGFGFPDWTFGFVEVAGAVDLGEVDGEDLVKAREMRLPLVTGHVETGGMLRVQGAQRIIKRG